jgi:hypothetical protein
LSAAGSGDALPLARGDRPVRNGRDARMSIHHAAALGSARERAGVAEVGMPSVLDRAMVALRAKVAAVAVRLRTGGRPARR